MAEEVSELAKAFMAMIPVAAGGAIGIAGSLGVNFLQQRAKRTEILRVKAEEALQYLYKSVLWLEEYRAQCLLDGEPMIKSWPPIDILEATVTLYFPDIEKELAAFVTEFTKNTSLAQDFSKEKFEQGKMPIDHKERWKAKNVELKSRFNAVKGRIRELANL
ncbi:hypothetical protein [Microbulbifer donghaiensis]|uniref:hypothetical protein n=1 Tax=Microbulbifer donghaiensis TaxID=494016 RepID=UPI0009352389|nr:hypothetical protein [Microbulbifer donghaiensis]